MRNPTPEPPVHSHTREYWQRLNDLRRSHPNIPVQELQHFLNHPPSLEEPAKPAPPKPPRTKAQILWPNMPSSEER